MPKPSEVTDSKENLSGESTEETPIVDELRDDKSSDESGEGTSLPRENESSSSQEVKIESKDAEKLAEQVRNLNIALKREKETARKMKEEIESKLSETASVTEKLKGVFSEEDNSEEEPKYVSQEELLGLKEELKEEIRQEQLNSQKVEEYKKEIKTLEKTWDGKDGKPKYNDEEVLSWQRENDKTYLSPADAFMQMKKEEIIDYEVKKRLNGSKPVVNVETPDSKTGNHEPEQPDKKNIDTRSAIMEAISSVEEEM